MTAFTGALGWAMPCAPSADAPALAERARIAEALLRLAENPALAQRVARCGENDLVDKTLLLRLVTWVRDGAVVPGSVTHG